MNLKVLSVNISEKKGTIKKPVEHIVINENGVANDAHAGLWHRQVSLLGTESVEKFAAMAKREISCGEFAENITTQGMLLYETKPLDRFVSGNMILEVTQIGKECHGATCAIFNEVGNCIMPKEGIFCRVVSGGTMKAGDQLEYQPKVIKILTITLSDRAASGAYSDRSGPQISKLASEYFDSIKRHASTENKIIPDDAAMLKETINTAINHYDLIFTTGGTGIGPRDITPETIKPLIDKEIPGIMEMIRVKYGMKKPAALISRGVAGVAGKSFIFTLPGSVKAVNEYMAEILPITEHLLYMLHGLDAH